MPTRTNADPTTSRDARINLRANSRQEQLIKAAAAATDSTLTDFVLSSAVVRAEKVLADRRYFLLTDEQWDEFNRLLDLPAPKTPRLDALLAAEAPVVVFESE